MLRHSLLATLIVLLVSSSAFAQIGKRFPSEKKVIPDPVTGAQLTFLTTGPTSDAKLYQTHQPWTSDGKWVIFRASGRAEGSQAFAVNEQSGVIVQLTEGPVSPTGSLNVAQKSMKLYYSRGGGQAGGQVKVYELDLATLFADSEAGKMKEVAAYERVCGALPEGLGTSGGFGLDANEDYAYIGVRGGDVGAKLPKTEQPYPGLSERFPGPGGIRSMNLKTGEVKFVVDVPFQMGHVQTNPWVPGEIIYCHETGGKAPQRMWTVMADGSGNRPLYAEQQYQWITHEAVITKDEVAFALLGHQPRLRQHPTGLAIVNLRSGATTIIGQPTTGRGLWHVNGSYDGRFGVGDDFARAIYLIDRRTSEILMLTSSHKSSAADHPHPIFNPAGDRILVQSAMLAEDNTALDLCVVPVPKAWLNRKYDVKVPD